MIRIGQQFAQVRQEQGLTLDEVARATKIREEFLRAIERGDFKSLPGSSYAYGFVSNYAKFLGLPVEKSLALFRREYDETKNVEVLPRGFTNPKEYSVSRFKVGRSAIAIFLVCLVVLAFVIFQYRSAIFNPALKVDSPKANSTVNSLNIQVTGRTDPQATLTIDGSQVSLDENGNFTKQITVFPGSVILDIKSENKFGKVSEIKRPVKVKP